MEKYMISFSTMMKPIIIIIIFLFFVFLLLFETAPHLQGSAASSKTIIFPVLPLHILVRPGLICVMAKFSCMLFPGMSFIVLQVNSKLVPPFKKKKKM